MQSLYYHTAAHAHNLYPRVSQENQNNYASSTKSRPRSAQRGVDDIASAGIALGRLPRKEKSACRGAVPLHYNENFWLLLLLQSQGVHNNIILFLTTIVPSCMYQSFLDVKYGVACGRSTTTSPARPKCLAWHCNYYGSRKRHCVHLQRSPSRCARSK